MDIYNYDADGFFISTSLADPNPLEPGEWLVPARSTIVSLPELADGETGKFNGESWEVVPDLLGVVYWLDDVEGRIMERGAPLPDGAVTVKPQSVVDAEMLAERKKYAGWVSTEHEKLVNTLLGGPSTIDITGWADNEKLAMAYLTGDQVAAERIGKKLKVAEAAMKDGMFYWSKLVTKVKVPYARYVYDQAEGVKRRAEERADAIDGLAFEAEMDDLKALAIDDADVVALVAGEYQENLMQAFLSDSAVQAAMQPA